MCRTTPSRIVSQRLAPLDEALRKKLVPSLTGTPPPNDTECTLFALPAREGGLGIRIPSKQATHEYNASQFVTSALCNHIIRQDTHYGQEIISESLMAKSTVGQQNRERTNTLTPLLSTNMQRSVNLSKEKGASSWLTTLPLKTHGFTLHKQAFRDALYPCVMVGLQTSYPRNVPVVLPSQ